MEEFDWTKKPSLCLLNPFLLHQEIRRLREQEDEYDERDDLWTQEAVADGPPVEVAAQEEGQGAGDAQANVDQVGKGA